MLHQTHLAALIAKLPAFAAMPVEAQENLLLREAKQHFYNTSRMELSSLGSKSRMSARNSLIAAAACFDSLLAAKSGAWGFAISARCINHSRWNVTYFWVAPRNIHRIFVG